MADVISGWILVEIFFQSAAVLLPAWCDGATAACWDDWIYPGANDYSTIC